MKDDKLYPRHILEAIEKIESYTFVGRDFFMKTSIIPDAVIRNLEIIGEASKQLSDSFKQRNADIPWRNVSGLRDILIHHYMGVDLEKVWNVVEQNLPQLKQAVQKSIP
ncbi:MAG TPA: DUF86 domain-containing protein [Syntrophales bacterium]|jgi:uncharacterized protein with HEPN domain|nr:DUF86 domain-containing protein [Syntrophales bacterium]